MVSFGKKLRECREAKGLSQQELAKKLGSAHTVIGRYERDEMTPSVEVAKKLAKILDTTVGFLLGESKDTNILKDPQMMKRLNEINELSEGERQCVYSLLDAFLAKAKLQAILK